MSNREIDSPLWKAEQMLANACFNLALAKRNGKENLSMELGDVMTQTDKVRVVETEVPQSKLMYSGLYNTR